MSAPQAALDSTEMTRRVQETHKEITRNYVDLAKRYADLDVDAQSWTTSCLLYTSPSPRDGLLSRMPSSA